MEEVSGAWALLVNREAADATDPYSCIKVRGMGSEGTAGANKLYFAAELAHAGELRFGDVAMLALAPAVP